LWPTRRSPPSSDEDAGEELQQRRLPRAVRTDERDALAALDQDVRAVVDRDVAVLLPRALQLEDRASAARRLGQPDLQRALVAVGRRQALDLLELLHPALHERRLRRLVAEAVDERLDPLDLRLLVLVRLSRLLEPLLALGEVAAVVHRVVGDAAVQAPRRCGRPSRRGSSGRARP
jgi:hypothetical protein